MAASAATGSDYGLTGQYYPDDGTHSFDGRLAGQRTDPGIDMQWPLNLAPVSGLGTESPFMTRWTGVLTLPPGTWALGGVTSGGMRITLNGSSYYNDWAGTVPGLLFGQRRSMGANSTPSRSTTGNPTRRPSPRCSCGQKT